LSLVGRKLGDFTLDKKLGAGGMGEVYRARQDSLDRIVAVKILPKSIASNEGFEERFRREARSAANLIHPNVIQVYHIGIDEELGTPFFAMEYVEGEDLQQRMKRLGRLPFDVSVELMAGVAAALSCAYEKGIVHRDIKPSNIMIDRNEIVKVMDFGLAKATQDKSSHNLTQSGLIMGTPNYISPEAGRGDPIDTRSDIYSLGVVFYELLTGVLPFTANSPAAIIYKHVYEAPKPPRQVTSDVPPFLEEICLRMIEKEPKDRYPNPKALLADLNEFKRNPGHYMQGGQRRTPVIGTGSITGDQTLTASGSFPGRAGQGSRTNDQTQTFREGETQQDAATLIGSPGSGAFPGGATQVGVGSSSQMRTGSYTQTGQPVGAPSSKLVPALVVALMLAVGAIGFFVAPKLMSNTGGTIGGQGSTGQSTIAMPAGKVNFPASRLEKLVPKGVKTLVLKGAGDQTELVLADVPVEPGLFSLVFRKQFFEDVKQTFTVDASGVSPAFESIKFDFKPSDEARKTVEAAKRALDDQRYKESMDLLQSIRESAPDYEEAASTYALAQTRYQRTRDLVNKGTTFYNQRRYGESLKAFQDIPPTYEDYRNIRSQMELAQGHLDALKGNRENFEKFFALGQYPNATTCLTEIESRVPQADPETRALREKLNKAGEDLEAGRRELESGNDVEAVKHLEALLKASPSHPEGAKLLDKARASLARKTGDVETLKTALANGETAYKAGQFEVAVNEARRGLAADPQSRAAQMLLENSLRRIAEAKITRRLGELDQAFLTLSAGSKEKKTFAIVQMIDPGSPAAAAVKADAELFAASPIKVEECTRSDLAFELRGGADATEAVVECSWNVALAFPDTEGATPPARGTRTALTVRQRIGMKRAGDVWLFTSFEEIGKANVK